MSETKSILTLNYYKNLSILTKELKQIDDLVFPLYCQELGKILGIDELKICFGRAKNDKIDMIINYFYLSQTEDKTNLLQSIIKHLVET
jgi:hypothetical protein